MNNEKNNNSLEKTVLNIATKVLEDQSNRNKEYVHPPFTHRESGDRTNVVYEAPKKPTNEYDVEIAKLEFEQWKMGKPGRTFASLFALGSLGLLAYGFYKYIKSENESTSTPQSSKSTDLKKFEEQVKKEIKEIRNDFEKETSFYKEQIEEMKKMIENESNKNNKTTSGENNNEQQ